jgi:hypothetical protein
VIQVPGEVSQMTKDATGNVVTGARVMELGVREFIEIGIAVVEKFQVPVIEKEGQLFTKRAEKEVF